MKDCKCWIRDCVRRTRIDRVVVIMMRYQSLGVIARHHRQYYHYGQGPGPLGLSDVAQSTTSSSICPYHHPSTPIAAWTMWPRCQKRPTHRADDIQEQPWEWVDILLGMLRHSGVCVSCYKKLHVCVRRAVRALQNEM